MPTVRADGRSPVLLLSAFVALALAVSGCAGSGRDEPASTPAAPGPGPGSTPPSPVGTGDAGRTPPVVEGMPVPPDLDAAFSELLERRSRAVLEGDRGAFLAGLDQGDAGFLVAQEGYFDNLTQLPLAAFSYDVDPASLVRGRGSYSVVVEITTQLAGYDALPVRTLDRFRFDPTGRPRDRGYLLASVTDRAWEELHRIRSQPWESRPVRVREGDGVLLVLDDASVAAARPLLRALERSVADVAARVPYGWDRTVVVYALSDTDFIRSLDDLPGDQPDALDGIAFTVPAGPGDATTAATRIVLNPRLLTRTDVARERLLRHELTHVAVADRDDHAPVWLSEGLAEWVSVQALPDRQRRIGTDALRAVRRGVATMPDDATFNTGDTARNYALSWWVVEYIAATYGDSAPWSVLDAFATPDTRERPTIRALLRTGVTSLARRGAALLIRTYVPADTFADAPAGSPADTPARTPTDTPDDTPTGTPREREE